MTVWQRRILRTSGLVAFLCLAALLFAWAAQAHTVAMMIYPPRCCGGGAVTGDCAPIEGVNAVQRHSDGWFIQETGETIPFDKTEPSQDLRFHRCRKPDNTTRCFFSPESGT